MSETVYYCPVCKVRPIFIADDESEHFSSMIKILETTPCSRCVDPVEYAKQLLKERNEGNAKS